MLGPGWVGRLALLGIAVAGFAATHASAATPATMTIESASQAGSAGSKGSKANKQPKGAVPANQIELLSVVRPGSDATSSAASGGVRKTGSTQTPASSLIVTKAYDSTSVQLEQAEATNEFLPQVTIAFATSGAGSGKGSVTGSANKKSKTGQASYKDPEDQTSKTAQVLVLKNVQITSIEQTRNIQKITIEYQSIEVTYVSGKTSFSDDWESQ